MSDAKYPDVTVVLDGTSGHAFAILGRVSKALRQAGAPQSEIDAFRAEATDGDYDHLLQTAMKWVNVE